MARLGRGRPNRWRPRSKVQVDVLNPVFDDALGATDTADSSLDAARLPEDTATFSDSVTYDLGHALTTSADDTAAGSDSSVLHRIIDVSYTTETAAPPAPSTGFGSLPFASGPFGAGSSGEAHGVAWDDAAAWSDADPWPAAATGPVPTGFIGATDSVSILLSQGATPADTAALTDIPTVVQEQFKEPADTLGATDTATTNFGTSAIDYVSEKDEVAVEQKKPATAAVQYAVTATPSGTTTANGKWTNTANATGATTATYATYTTAISAEQGVLELAGYSFPAPTPESQMVSNVDSVAVQVRSYVGTASRWTGFNAQLFSGTTAIGSPVTFTAAAGAANVSTLTLTFTGANTPTWDQLADLRVRVTATKANTTSDTFNLDLVSAAVSYTNVYTPQQFINYLPPIPADPVGITDSTDQVQTQFKDLADTLPITDPHVTTATNFRSASDSATGTDSVVAIRGLPERTPADAATLSDSVTFVQGQTTSAIDTATGSDTAVRVQNMQRPPADALAATDTVTWIKFVNAGNEQIGLTDTPQTAMQARRTAADSAGITDSVEVSGTSSRPVKSTANVVADSAIGMRRTARLKARPAVAVRATVTGDLKVGPQRLPVRTTITGELTHPRLLSGVLEPDVDFPNQQIRIVRAMTTAIRMTDEELAMQALEKRMAVRLTNVAEPEPEFDPFDDPDYLPEPVVASGPRRYSRSFETLRL